jgi:hypothetical protein
MWSRVGGQAGRLLTASALQQSGVDFVTPVFRTHYGGQFRLEAQSSDVGKIRETCRPTSTSTKDWLITVARHVWSLRTPQSPSTDGSFP